MNRDRRTVKDSIDMAASLAEAMGSKLVKHPTLLEADDPREVGFTYENFQGGTFLLLRVDEQGRYYYPFGNIGLKHADFWMAGCFALTCMDRLKEQQARDAAQPDVSDCAQCMADQATLEYHKRDWLLLQDELSTRDGKALAASFAIKKHLSGTETDSELTRLVFTFELEQAQEVIRSAARLGIA